MKIAVACASGAQVSSHFGRSEHFIVFDVQDGKVIGQENRQNTWTAHVRGESHDHDAGGPHDHAGVVDALRDCQAVICAGMGFRAAEALRAGGVAPLVLAQPCSPEMAVSLFLEGKVTATTSSFCRCGHHDHPKPKE